MRRPRGVGLAGLVSSATARGQSATFTEKLLAAYGGPGVEELGAFLEAHALYEVVWRAYQGGRHRDTERGSAASGWTGKAVYAVAPAALVMAGSIHPSAHRTRR